MNTIIKLFVAVFSLVVVFSCAKGDGDADYGNCLIYIPQATQSGGTGNQYNVPSGEGPYTYNFRIEDDRILAMLGVSRSGKYAAKAYSVDVVEDLEASEEFIANTPVAADGKSYMVMPKEMRSFPPTISVPDGSVESSFYVEISRKEMSGPEYDTKILVLTLKLQNPTVYELAAENTEVTVLLDTDAMEAYL